MSEDILECRLTALRVDFFDAAGVGLIGVKSSHRRARDEWFYQWCTEKRYE